MITTPEKVNERSLKVELSHNPSNGNFYIDFSDEDGYIVSVNISENVAVCIGRDLGIKILQ